MSVQLRAAQPTDAGATGDVLWKYLCDTDWMPKLYSAAEAIGFCGSMIDRGWVTVANVNDHVVGFIARDKAEIHALYLKHNVVGRGIGKMLLNDAKSRSGRLDLWTFQAATGAQRFYLRQGFVELDRTDGTRNDENLPDIHYIWSREIQTRKAVKK